MVPTHIEMRNILKKRNYQRFPSLSIPKKGKKRAPHFHKFSKFKKVMNQYLRKYPSHILPAFTVK